MNTQRGFNILELMMAIAVLAALIGVGVPGMQAYIYNSRLTTQLNSLATTLAHARSEAIKLNQRVMLCVSTDGKQCEATGSGTYWSKGWLLFVDRNKDGNIDSGGVGVDDCGAGSTTDCVINVQAAFDGNNNLVPATGVEDYVIYIGDGSMKCASGGDISKLVACSNDTSYFTLCDFRGAKYSKALAVSNTGRVSIIDKQPNGSDLTCP